MSAFDAKEIERSLKLFHPDGEVFEVRVLEAAGAYLGGRTEWRTVTVAGYFNDSTVAAHEIVAALGDATFTGVYHSMNPINSALLARAANRLRRADKMPLTSDKDVLRRWWLLIDSDPVRPAGVSATDDEKEAALDVLCAVEEHLAAEGWPAPVIADSGNGFHGAHRVDLPADDGEVVKTKLADLSRRFSTARATIDVTVFNPARIIKVYGTPACKGDNTPDRPHRLSRLLEVPE